MSYRALVLQHGESSPPGLLNDWAETRGIALEIHRTDLQQQLPVPDSYAFVASLGSKHNPGDLHIDAVRAERIFLEQAVDNDTPVLGLCFGGQMLAAVLGGQVEPAPEPELGWYEVTSRDPHLVPSGPWLQWHFDRFILPAGVTALAESTVGAQAFVCGPHLGVQFHPESTIAIVRRWALADQTVSRHWASPTGWSASSVDATTRPPHEVPHSDCSMASGAVHSDDRGDSVENRC
jgi:GMP synthase-like glutamine amidotransferase